MGEGSPAQGLVTSLTFRMPEKTPASELHSLLWGPFIMLVLFHLYLAAPGGPRGPKKER